MTVSVAHRVPRSAHRFDFDPVARPVLRVPAGARVVFETLDCFSNQITSADQRFTHEEELLALIGAYNPVAGPVYVDGAEPGDVLAVTIEEIQLGTAGRYAVTLSFGTGSRIVQAPCPDLPPDADIRICPLDGDSVLLPTSRGALRLPVRPMVGTIGTAPAGTAAAALRYGAGHGGNFDCPFVAPGATVFLPVNVPGALLSLGDVHALMGAAEITGTALETSGDVTVRIDVLPAGRRALTLPHVDTVDRIGVVGCRAGAGLEENLQEAMSELHARLRDEVGFSSADAYHLLGAVADVEVNQCVAGGWKSVYASMPRAAVALGAP